MRRIATRTLMALLFFGLPLASCGGDEEERAERGLTPPQEEAVPDSQRALEQTEEERERENAREE